MGGAFPNRVSCRSHNGFQERTLRGERSPDTQPTQASAIAKLSVVTVIVWVVRSQIQINVEATMVSGKAPYEAMRSPCEIE